MPPYCDDHEEYHCYDVNTGHTYCRSCRELDLHRVYESRIQTQVSEIEKLKEALAEARCMFNEEERECDKQGRLVDQLKTELHKKEQQLKIANEELANDNTIGKYARERNSDLLLALRKFRQEISEILCNDEEW